MPVIDDSHPETLEGLKELFRRREYDDDEAHSSYYEHHSRRLVSEFENTAFWKDFVRQLADLAEKRKLDGELALLAHADKPPTVVAKPWDSLLSKCFRKNVLENSRYPKTPDEGWVTEENWLERVHDIVRTTVVVRYLDGIHIVRRLLREVAGSHGIKVRHDFEAKDEGYYAVHAAIPMQLPYREERWKMLFANVEVEVQLCTQIQEVIRSLTHSLYEERRVHPREPGMKWQWECECEEFVPNYLGHMLHYADGMIMNIRRLREEAS